MSCNVSVCMAVMSPQLCQSVMRGLFFPVGRLDWQLEPHSSLSHSSLPGPPDTPLHTGAFSQGRQLERGILVTHLCPSGHPSWSWEGLTA